MNMQEDLRPDHSEMFETADRLSILTEMLIELQARRNEISHATYMNGLSMIERLAGGEEL